MPAGLVVAVVLLIGPPGAEDLGIEVPADPVAINQYLRLGVRGLAVTDLPNAKFTYWPREGVFAVESLTWRGEPYIAFVAAKPGTYLLAIACARGGGLAYGEAVITVEAAPIPPGPSPPPGPGPPPPGPPDQGAEAKKRAYMAAMKLPPMARADAIALSQVYAKLAEQIGGKLKDFDQLITASRLAREMVVDPRRAADWAAWAKEMGAWLDAERTADRLTKIEQAKSIWLGIAAGLAEVK